MSERMTDMAIGHALGVMMSACEFPPSGAEHVEARRAQLKALHDEIDSARASEKALADALEMLRNNRCQMLSDEREAVDAALRLAGRL
jgi:cell division protein FtsB